MSNRALNWILLLLFLLSLGFNWALRRNPEQPNREFLPEMVRTPRYNAFAPNPNFADGKTLQLPVLGAIPRGLPPLRFEPGPAGALRAGEELHNPFAVSGAEVLQRGTAVFANFCQVCHGSASRGDGPVVSRGFPAPPSLLTERAMKMKDGQIFHILAVGQGNMPSYAAQISRDDRWRVIAHIRTLQSKPAVPSLGSGR